MIEWKDPPPLQPGRPGTWIPIADELRQHPRQWARIKIAATQSAAQTLATYVRKGGSRVWQPAQSFEVQVRDSEVYARYVGDTDEAGS